MAKKKKEIISEDKLKVSTAALEKLFEELVVEGEDYDVEMSRPSERSEDTWGLKSVEGAYESNMSVDTIEDEYGNIKTKVYKW
jgi:hypothetical protein